MSLKNPVSFTNLAPLYFDKGMSVVPIKPGYKHPRKNNWQNINFEETYKEYSNYGIAIKCGKSGIMALDIDILDKKKQEKIKKILPPIYCGKVGNPEKLPTIFYQYEDKFQDIKQHGIELIINARICVLPPTFHPDTKKPYYWIGRSLLECEVDDLPLLDESLLKDILLIASEGESKDKTIITQSDGTRCNHGSHLTLSELAMACIHQGYSVEETVKSLIKKDSEINQKISYFLCNSDKPILVKDKAYNAYEFALKHYKSNLSNNFLKEIPLNKSFEFNLVASEEKEERKEFFTRKNLPHWKGIGAQIFDHIYQSSIIPRSRFSWAATLSIISTCIGNSLRYKKTMANTYCLIIAPSAFGKNDPLMAPNDLFMATNQKHLIGNGKPRSDVGLIMNLPAQRERLDTIDEMKNLFTGMSNSKSHMNGIAEMYAELFTSVGRYFSGNNVRGEKTRKGGNELGNVGGCFSPFVSVLGAITPEGFERSFTSDFIEEGLGSRILYFWDLQPKMPRDEQKDIYDINEDITDFINHWANFSTEDPNRLINDKDKFTIPECQINDKAKAALKEYSDEIIKECLEEYSKTKSVDSIKHRSTEYLTKLALIGAVSRQWMPEHPSLVEIQLQDVQWAKNALIACLAENEFYINTRVARNKDMREINKVKQIIFESAPNLLSKSELMKKTGMFAKRLDEILGFLISTEQIKTKIIETKSKPKNIYYPNFN